MLMLLLKIVKMDNLALARHNMVQNQIIPSHVHDNNVITAMREIPKHMFVAPGWQAVAYSDGRLPVSAHRTLLQPETLAKMLQACNITKHDVVLEIGCATGYTTALLAKMAKEVVAMDNDENFIAKADDHLQQLKIKNVSLCVGELINGHPNAAPYGVIFMNGKLRSKHLGTLLAQLDNNGRLIVIEDCAGITKAVLYTNIKGKISHTELFAAAAEYIG